jgi:Uma2 family endonuclease
MIQPVSQPARKATAADLLAAYGEDGRAEIIHGEILEKAMPRLEHGISQSNHLAAITHRFHRRASGRWPGGWWIASELHVEYETNELYCHDAVGYRRDRHPELPKSWPMKLRPDWVCELLSRNHWKRDLLDKWRVLQAAGVPHYWIIDPEEKFLQVHRLQPAGYVCILAAGAGETIRAEPFEAVELRTSVLFGDEDDDE